MPNDQQDSMPVDADDMMRFTPTMFGEAAREAQSSGFSKLVVFIDALNQMDDVGRCGPCMDMKSYIPCRQVFFFFHLFVRWFASFCFYVSFCV